MAGRRLCEVRGYVIKSYLLGSDSPRHFQCKEIKQTNKQKSLGLWGLSNKTFMPELRTNKEYKRVGDEIGCLLQIKARQLCCVSMWPDRLADMLPTQTLSPELGTPPSLPSVEKTHASLWKGMTKKLSKEEEYILMETDSQGTRGWETFVSVVQEQRGIFEFSFLPKSC